jgi:hypothetical protein
MGFRSRNKDSCYFLDWLAESSATDLVVVAAEIVVSVVG